MLSGCGSKDRIRRLKTVTLGPYMMDNKGACSPTRRISRPISSRSSSARRLASRESASAFCHRARLAAAGLTVPTLAMHSLCKRELRKSTGSPESAI